MGHIPLDDDGFYGDHDAAAEAQDQARFEERWTTPAMIGVKMPDDDAAILILAKVGGIGTVNGAAQHLLQPKSQGASYQASPWVDGQCDPFGTVPYLTMELMEISDQELDVWATSSMALRAPIGTIETWHPRFPVIDFGAMVVRAFEIKGGRAQELTSSWSFEEFADEHWQRRGHPFHTLDPEFVRVNRLTFAPEWAELIPRGK